jgi:SpoVK/Ycf46/Vps4 family AAA+-type ATPase
MAVQVVARRLGLTLYRVDLSALISKWVGETSKHIEALLRAAADARVLLLFDEADSLFGKRAQEQRDAQDRYVNMDSSHLLAALETFPGVAVLATNLRGNLDHAFTRRLRHVVSFPKPGPVERLEIWRRVMTALAGAEAADALRGDLAVLAGGVELTGAEIKNACLGALFSARRSQEPLARRHLVQALTRELTKAGRSLSERERQRLMQHGG